MTVSGRYQTCYIVKFPKIHFNVIPLHDHAAVGVWGSQRHIDVLLEGENVCRHGLNRNGLMTHKICSHKQKLLEKQLNIKTFKQAFFSLIVK